MRFSAPGEAITYETFFDDHGRAQGSTSGRFADVDAGATDWTCTTYDDRGRPTETDHPAFDGTPGRTVSYNHAVAGNPLVSSVTDPAGTITTKADLLGRVVSTTDVWGVITNTTYDAAGRAASSTVVAGSTSFARATEYDAYSRPITHKLDGQPIAQVAFDDADRMTSVTYPSGSGNAGNGTSGAFTYSASTGELNKSSWAQANSTLLTSDEVTSRWLTGRIRNQATDGVDPNGATDNYTYDGAWRLTGATVARPGGTNSYAYGFAATGGCGDLTTAGANSNRTSKTVTPSGGSPVATQYCYDNADRLTANTDTSVGTLGYDDHGNTDTLGDETHVYDNANRHLSTIAPASVGGATAVEYLRDATDRIVQRKVNGTVEARYAHSASGDTPTLALDASNAVTGASLGLPGGVLYKWLPTTPGASLWEYPNLQGSLVATATHAGTKVGATRVYDPDGNSVIGTTPDTGPGDFDYGWLGGHQRPLEHHDDLQPIIQMGARQYHPQLGRFLEVDPVEAGVHNDYAYAADPVNQTDLDGRALGPNQVLWCASESGADCKAAFDVRDRANELYGIWKAEFGSNTANAMKHFYWMARTTKIVGAKDALRLGEAHEQDGGNGYWDTNRDRANNRIGAGFADQRFRTNHEIVVEARRRANGMGLYCTRVKGGIGRTWGSHCK